MSDPETTTPCTGCTGCPPQPPTWEHTTRDGIFIKQMWLREANTVAPQHAHSHDHVTLLATGSVMLVREGMPYGTEYRAPAAIHVPAHTLHSFVALEDNTMLYCIHNADRIRIERYHNADRIRIERYHSVSEKVGAG